MQNQKYQSSSFYIKLSESIQILSGIIIFNFAKHECTKKEIILRNFVARSSTSLKSIMTLWNLEDYPSAWVINRTIVDRLFHLHYLGENNSYQLFDNWSFYENYKYINKVKSDVEFKQYASGKEYNISKEQKERSNELSRNKIDWKRPDAQAIAKDMDMTFLYKYGYDYASKFVHPMSDDGLHDFHLITKLEPLPDEQSHIVVLHNSILVSTMIIQESINQGSFLWHEVIYDCLEQFRNSLQNGNESYIETMNEIITSKIEISRCKI